MRKLNTQKQAVTYYTYKKILIRLVSYNVIATAKTNKHIKLLSGFNLDLLEVISEIILKWGQIFAANVFQFSRNTSICLFHR